MTVTECAATAGKKVTPRSTADGIPLDLLPKVKIEMVLPDQRVESAVEAILKAAENRKKSEMARSFFDVGDRDPIRMMNTRKRALDNVTTAARPGLDPKPTE